MKVSDIDLLVKNAYVVTMDSQRRVINDGYIGIKNGVITEVGLIQDISPEVSAETVIDAHGALVHPGFIDTHIHLLYHNIRWANEDGVGWDTGALPIHGEYGSLLGQGLTEAVQDSDDIAEASIKLAALEMARNGTTCFLEAGGVSQGDLAAQCIEEIGIRGMLGGPFVKDISPDNPVSTPASLDEAVSNMGLELGRNTNPDSLVRGVVTISGMGSASDELLLAAKSMADEHGVIFNMHQSYWRGDAENDDLRLGRHPLVHYFDIGVLGENCTFSHVNIVRDDEMRPVIDSGMSISWCPIASMLYGVGGSIQGKHLELYKQGQNIALGCDSANWTSSFDVGEQAFIALLTAREKTEQSDALVAEDVFEMATINGAKAIGMSDTLGSLEVGKKADLVIRKSDLPESFPELDPIRSVIFSSRSRSVDTVIVDGQIIVKGACSTRVDEQEIFARSNEISQDVLERLDRSPPSGPWKRI
tara:strand:+ start:2287 stop:3711 length:1425 start_codon:yes stop_codon:yes gene_type:complete